MNFCHFSLKLTQHSLFPFSVDDCFTHSRQNLGVVLDSSLSHSLHRVCQGILTGLPSTSVWTLVTCHPSLLPTLRHHQVLSLELSRFLGECTGLSGLPLPPLPSYERCKTQQIEWSLKFQLTALLPWLISLRIRPRVCRGLQTPTCSDSYHRSDRVPCLSPLAPSAPATLASLFLDHTIILAHSHLLFCLGHSDTYMAPLPAIQVSPQMSAFLWCSHYDFPV